MDLNSKKQKTYIDKTKPNEIEHDFPFRVA